MATPPPSGSAGATASSPNTYGGLPLVDPLSLYRDCIDRALPTDWYGLPNTYSCQLEMAPGVGYVLMWYRDLVQLSRTAEYDLVLKDDLGQEVRVKKLSIVKARCVTPGFEGDPASVFLVTLEDTRSNTNRQAWYAGSLSFPFVFNHVTDVGQEYDKNTTKAGPVVWTWTQMVEKLWTQALDCASFTPTGTPAYPGLPFTPHGVPDRFDYSKLGIGGGEVLDHVLTRLACALKYNPVADTYSIVRLGATDSAASAVETSLRPTLVWADQPQAGEDGTTAVAFTMFFNIWYWSNTQPTQRYNVKFPTGAPSTRQRLVPLIDDFHWRVGMADATMIAYAQDRADERSSDYQRVRARFERARTNVYQGFHPSAVTMLGSQWNAVAWYDRGQGARTEVAVVPWRKLETWRPMCDPPLGPPIFWGRIGGGTLNWSAGAANQQISGVLSVPHDAYVTGLFFYDVTVETATTGDVTVDLYETNSGGTKTGVPLHSQTINVSATEMVTFNHWGRYVPPTSTAFGNALKYYALFVTSAVAGNTVTPANNRHGTNLGVLWIAPRTDEAAGDNQVTNPTPT